MELRERVGEEVGQLEKDYLRKSAKDASGDISAHPFHMADAASDSFDTEFNIGLASNEKNVLYEIDAALRRIKEGTFGICEKYGTPISKKRLKAMPYARYSIKSAGRRGEKNGRTMGKVLIIGAGGVGGVVTHKCAQVPEVFGDTLLASRTLEKCDRIAGEISRPIETAKVDADHPQEVAELIRKFNPDLVINVALPYQDLSIMDALS